MNEFLDSIVNFYLKASFGSLAFWAFPLLTLLGIWLLATVGLKIGRRKRKLKSVFKIHRSLMVSSLFVSGVLISLLCYWWATNYFAEHPYEFALLFSLLLALLVPIFVQFSLRSHYRNDGLKELVNQPKTDRQFVRAITFTKKAFGKNKIYYVLPLLGFIFLLFYLYKGTNLIAIVYDNSTSMDDRTASEALNETFDQLEENNQIVFATLNANQGGIGQDTAKADINQIMAARTTTDLVAGTVIAFNNPEEAVGNLGLADNSSPASPISESIWKTWLFIKETKAEQPYRNKLLVVITDGGDNVGASLANGKFFFDDEAFAEYFNPDNVFITDFSQGASSPLIQRFQNAGCDVFPVENRKQDYLDALDHSLSAFKNDWNLVYWTLLITGLLAAIGLLVPPKKVI